MICRWSRPFGSHPRTRTPRARSKPRTWHTTSCDDAARPFNHLGPGQSVNFVVPALISRLLDAKERGDREIPVGDLSTRRDFCDVRDVVRAYRLLAQYGLTGEAYNVASGRDVLLSDLCAQLVQRIAPEI